MNDLSNYIEGLECKVGRLEDEIERLEQIIDRLECDCEAYNEENARLLDIIYGY